MVKVSAASKHKPALLYAQESAFVLAVNRLSAATVAEARATALAHAARVHPAASAYYARASVPDKAGGTAEVELWNGSMAPDPK